MFKSLNLKATYSSYEDDIGAIFYSPVLKECINYDRATAYFSAKALASYASGFEAFARRGNKCRMIVSAQLSDEDYQQISTGYQLRESIDQSLLSKLREDLSLEEERNISNLAYLISLGIIDIKIAFTRKGIFHDKFGIMEDEVGDVICFRGSNNETEAAFNSNYEAFDITCSWQTSSFDYSKITKSKETFDNLWNNRTKNVIVCEIGDTIQQEILSHSKGKMIINIAQLATNCLLLDYDQHVLTLTIKIDPTLIFNNSLYKLRLKKYVDTEASSKTVICFQRHLTYPTFKKIICILEQDSETRNYQFYTTKRLRDYIANREMYIEERAMVGLEIKRQSPIVQKQFLEYKSVVDQELSRQLREKQMWDSFFMCTMKKSCNFSVPGSGKTASVLGVFAYLQVKGLANKIVMIGPKSSFETWADEFRACFGDKKQLRLFNIQSYLSKIKQEAILYETGNKNLLLFNYESIGTYLPEIKKIIDTKTLLVFDEVHKVKAIGGSRANDALAISEDACYTIALTGTPIPNSYLDIENLLNILYHDEYNEFFGFTEQQLRSPTTTDIAEINEKLLPFFCRTTKQQLQVPDASPDKIIQFDATNAENQLFKILLQKYAHNKLALIIRLLQLESDPKMLLQKLDISEFADVLDTSGSVEQIDYVNYSEDLVSLIHSVENTSKYNECVKLAKGLLSEQKPTIIWCIFVDSIFQIQKALKKTGARVGCICGSTNMEDRQQILLQFRSGFLDFLITNPHTLAESISLHNFCHDAIYYEYSYNLVHLLQSKDRIHRLGLPSQQYTQYYFLQETFLTPNGMTYSLDGEIYRRLKEKEQVMLEAIENGVLENGSTPEEDMRIIFSTLGL